MHVAVGLVSLVLAVLALTALADRLRLPPPVLLVAAGAAAAYAPGVSEVRLSPEVVLVGGAGRAPAAGDAGRAQPA